MSTLHGNTLPPEVQALFEPVGDVEGQCFLLATGDPDGTPRPCVLSAAEIAVKDPSTLRLLLWPTSRTTENLARGGTAVLTAVAPPAVFHIRLAPRDLPNTTPSGLSRFELSVTSVESDGHEGMPVVASMRFRVQPELAERTLALWRDQRRELTT